MLYRFILLVYSNLFLTTIPFILMKKMIQSRHNKAHRQRWFERLGQVKFSLKKSILIHSVSVGESISIAPLVKQISIEYSDISIVVTTMTLTGSTQVTKLYQNYTGIYHTYLPYDIPLCLNNFFQHINPQICIIMETELWPNLLAICYKKSIPVILTNARMSKKSFNIYSKIKFITQNMLSHISHINAQNSQDKDRFVSLGMRLKNITVTGNIKYDFLLDPNVIRQGRSLKEQIGKRPIWIAASTHRTEEEIILQAHLRIQSQYPQALLIIVPRHPERFDTVYRIIKKYKFRVIRRSFDNGKYNSLDVYLADTMGELMMLYAVSDIAFVGGSFSANGGHNTIEPAALSKVIFSGPSTFNFEQITQSLLKKEALIVVKSSRDLAAQIIILFQDKRKQKIMGRNAFSCYNANKGAFSIQLALIKKFINASKMVDN